MTATALQKLGTPDLDLADLSALVTALEDSQPEGRIVKYGVSANVTVDLLEPYLKRQALLDGHRARVLAGSYDDHIGNVRRFREQKVDAVVLLSFFDNLVPALEAKIPTMEPAELDALRERAVAELRLVLEEARTVDRVYLCMFHRMAPPSATGLHSRVDEAISAFNAVIRNEASAHPNVRILDLDEVVSRAGWARTFAPRFYFRYRAPYGNPFFEELARQISVAGRAAGSHYLKALVLDADNTLWGGIVGEDTPEKVRLNPHDYPGSIYWRVQQELLALQRSGVLLCLNSKNNPADVDQMLTKHPHMVLRSEHFAARQVNWDDKATNIRRLAATLNIGLDAMAFLDDSSFECEAVRGQLPMVRTFLVPDKIHEYPAVIHQLKELFLGGGISAESAGKTEQYRIRALAEEERQRFASQEEYLGSLGIKVDVRLGERAEIKRISELSQKSNQFNVTTRRYSEGQIQQLMEAADAEVYSVHVRDRFGDSGLTGVVILRYRSEVVEVDSCLLSCRVIGRGVEFAIWPKLLERAATRGARTIVAEYLPTAKNAQVKDYYDRLGLPLVDETENGRRYRASLDGLKLAAAPHIEVNCVL